MHNQKHQKFFDHCIDILLCLVKDWINGVPSRLPLVSDSQWEFITRLAQRMDIAPILYRQLKISEIDIHKTFLEYLKKRYLVEAIQYMKREAMLGRMTQALALHGITPVFFKGVAFSNTIYPHPVYRTMDDIDLWVDESEIADVQIAFEQIGFVYEKDRSILPTLEGGYERELKMFDTGPGRGLVELHRFIHAGGWMRYTTAFDKSGIRGRLVSQMLHGFEVMTISPEDSLIQVAVHIAIGHQMSDHVIRSLIDIALIARNSPVDWELVTTRALAWRVATATWLVIKLSRDMVGLSGVDAVLRRLSPPSWKQWILSIWINTHCNWIWGKYRMEIYTSIGHTFQDSSKTRNYTPITASRLRFLLQLMLIDRGSDFFRMIFRGFWPKRDWLISRCGKADFSTRLHYLREAFSGNVVEKDQ